MEMLQVFPDRKTGYWVIKVVNHLNVIDLLGMLDYTTALEYEILHVSDELLSEIDPLGLLNYRCYYESYELLHDPDKLLQRDGSLGSFGSSCTQDANKLETKSDLCTE